ncbi:hypothetical protein FKM82_006315 [Ascaphus truei]
MVTELPFSSTNISSCTKLIASVSQECQIMARHRRKGAKTTTCRLLNHWRKNNRLLKWLITGHGTVCVKQNHTYQIVVNLNDFWGF